MLVYGDRSEFAEAGERLASIAEQLEGIARLPAGLDRHARLVRVLIEAGQLLQGVADRGDSTDQIDLFLHQLAAAVVRSTDTGFKEIGGLPSVPAAPSSGQLELRVPEGFAFYALYPEAYIAAARQLRLTGPPRVIGIRSIGTTLGAIVAATLGAAPALTVRPFGDPYEREVELPLSAIQPGAHYVIVDEGPGFSGSSFGAVADWLERHGVPLDRIAFLPSHGGDLGPQASEAHRSRWRRARRVPATFDSGFLREGFGVLEPFSTGYPSERVKFRATSNGEPILLKFAGLGAIGERKLELARSLHAAGFTAEPLELVHGFLAERWLADAVPLEAGEKPVQEIGHYIGARARLFPAERASGACIDELTTMCRRNIGLAFGKEVTQALDHWDAAALERCVKRVRTDNKLDRCEWLRLPDARLLKADALDHHQAHDLIGCQDMAWDVAGAVIEFGLTAAEADRLTVATGREVDPELLAFYHIAYAAFRLGQATLSGADCEPYRRSLELLLQERTASRLAEILV